MDESNYSQATKYAFGAGHNDAAQAYATLALVDAVQELTALLAERLPVPPAPQPAPQPAPVAQHWVEVSKP